MEHFHLEGLDNIFYLWPLTCLCVGLLDICCKHSIQFVRSFLKELYKFTISHKALFPIQNTDHGVLTQPMVVDEGDSCAKALAQKKKNCPCFVFGWYLDVGTHQTEKEMSRDTTIEILSRCRFSHQSHKIRPWTTTCCESSLPLGPWTLWQWLYHYHVIRNKQNYTWLITWHQLNLFPSERWQRSQKCLSVVLWSYQEKPTTGI